MKEKIAVCLFLVLLLVLCGCAPKRVALHESLSEVRSDLIQNAVLLTGKPYRSGAKGPDSFDCSGFVHYVYRRCDMVLPVSSDSLLKSGYEIQRENALPGDLVFFKIKKELHVGVMLNRNQFIHASKSRGVAVDDLGAPYWKKSLLTFRSIL